LSVVISLSSFETHTLIVSTFYNWGVVAQKTDMVWVYGENGRQEITSKSLILLRGWIGKGAERDKERHGWTV